VTVEQLTELVFAVARGPRGKELAELLLARAAEYGPPEVDVVIDAVAAELGLERETITGRSQRPEAVQARHLAMYLSSVLTRATYTEIGRKMNRTHSTAMSAIEKVAAMIASDKGDEARLLESRVLARLGNERRRREVVTACPLDSTT